MEDNKDSIHRDFEPFSPLSDQIPKNKITTGQAIRHIVLFILTFASVSYTGILYVGLGGDGSTINSELLRGVTFASALLSFLTVHEFGHYFAAVYHKVKVSLPYFIPLPLIAIGTLGAIIRIKERITRMHIQFDIGIAGPLAGFVVSLIVLIIGFSTLPEPDFINQFGGHDETKAYIAEFGTYPDEILDKNPVGVLIIGDTILYSFIASFFDNVPPMWEMYHFPLLFAGWLGLFFTALNLMPVGQLDGGHVLYSLIGYDRHRQVARLFFVLLTALAGVSAIPLLFEALKDIDNVYATVSWLVWASVLFVLMVSAMKKDQQWTAFGWVASLILTAVYIYIIDPERTFNGNAVWLFWIVLLTYFIKIEHPPVLKEEALSPGRKVLGWLSMLIFILCISPNPISIITE